MNTRGETPFVFIARNEAETETLGSAIGRALEAGGTVALVGTLGAGKTRLAQAIAEALGVDRREISSPTFILIQEYQGRLPIYHVDTYRLRSVDDFLDLGADEMYEGESVCLIEWADRVDSVLPADRLQIEIDVVGPNERRFRIEALGSRSAAVLAAARDSLRLSQP